MPAANRLSRRSPASWAARASLAIGIGVLGWISCTHSLAMSVRTRNPVLAHKLAPAEGRVAGTFARHLLGADADTRTRAKAAGIAEAALRHDPTSVPAAATLGLHRQLSGDTAGARRWFGYSMRLSRRDLPTRLWALEEAVARNDIPDVLAHYDIALRTSRAAPALLFPILAGAISDESVRTPLTRKLLTRPAWAEQLVDHLAGSGTDPKSAALLFTALGRGGYPISEPAQTGLINMLVSRDLIEDAWRFYASRQRGVDRRRSRDPMFAKDARAATAFDWTVADEGGVTSAIQNTGGKGFLEFSAPPLLGGVAVRQLQVLPPGAYVLEGRSTGSDLPPDAKPFWTLSCRNGPELGRIPVSGASEAGRFSGMLRVPEGCAAQMLVLTVPPTDAPSGSAGQITFLQLRPA